MLALWAAIAIAGICGLASYAGRAGASAAPPASDAAGAGSVTGTPIDGRHRLLLFVHPKCPCSRATIEALDRIVARAGSRLSTTVWFWCDPDAKDAETWVRGELWDAAAAIPGVEVRADAGGAAAQRFDAKTSGQCILYSPAGELEFSGGITPARGHCGDDAGTDAIVARASGAFGSQHQVATTPVFGCAFSAECER